jgi:hypothetical protein
MVLPRLDRDRKASVVQFLYDVGLISRERPVLELLKANLLHEPGGRKVQALLTKRTGVATGHPLR